MTDRNSTRTETTTRQPTITTPSGPTGRYPKTEANREAPLVPFIRQPSESDETTDIQGELAELRRQLNRIEQTIQDASDAH
jgi:hypothetical protein